jgi:hypothetical protein
MVHFCTNLYWKLCVEIAVGTHPSIHPSISSEKHCDCFGSSFLYKLVPEVRHANRSRKRVIAIGIYIQFFLVPTGTSTYDDYHQHTNKHHSFFSFFRHKPILNACFFSSRQHSTNNVIQPQQTIGQWNQLMIQTFFENVSTCFFKQKTTLSFTSLGWLSVKKIAQFPCSKDAHYHVHDPRHHWIISYNYSCTFFALPFCFHRYKKFLYPW